MKVNWPKLYKDNPLVARGEVAYYYFFEKADNSEITIRSLFHDNEVYLSPLNMKRRAFTNYFHSTGLQDLLSQYIHELSHNHPEKRNEIVCRYRYIVGINLDGFVDHLFDGGKISTRYLSTRQQLHIEKLNQLNRRLNANDELLLVNCANVLCYIGYGISKQKLLDIANAIWVRRLSSSDIYSSTDPLSMKYLHNLMLRHSSLTGLISARPCDIVRITSCNIETRNTWFTTIDAYVKFMKTLNLWSYNSLSEVPASQFGNSDEVGINSLKRITNIKVLGNKKVVKRKFNQSLLQIAEEGTINKLINMKSLLIHFIYIHIYSFCHLLFYPHRS